MEGRKQASSPLIKVSPCLLYIHVITDPSFSPASFDHGSAQNIAIITRDNFPLLIRLHTDIHSSEFICDRVNSGCGADNTAKATCTKAQAAAASAARGTGAQADLFNAVFGINTVRLLLQWPL